MRREVAMRVTCRARQPRLLKVPWERLVTCWMSSKFRQVWNYSDLVRNRAATALRSLHSSLFKVEGEGCGLQILSQSSFLVQVDNMRKKDVSHSRFHACWMYKAFHSKLMLDHAQISGFEMSLNGAWRFPLRLSSYCCTHMWRATENLVASPE